MKKILLATIAMIALSLLPAANASTHMYSIPEFSGNYVPDPGPFDTYLVGTFQVFQGTGSLEIDGTFGNSAYPNSAGVDVFAGSMTDGFNLIAQCFEFDPCWTGSAPTPWSATLTGLFPDDSTWSIYASQTSGNTVRLGEITTTQILADTAATPEPSTFLFLGTGLFALAAVYRRSMPKQAVVARFTR